MGAKKYSKVLTILLIAVIIAILGILGFWGFQIYKKVELQKAQNAALQEFDNKLKVIKRPTNTTDNNNINSVTNYISETNTVDVSSSSTSTNKAKTTYHGFAVAGKLEIPAIKLKYVVLERATKTSMENSLAIAYGPGLNKVGNTVILGHNYRDGTFFSNNKNLNNGDKAYVTDDETGKRISYTIYNKYITSSDDFDYATRDTQGKREISLSTCTDDVKERLVIWAKED